MLWSAFTLAFFGFLRSSEFTSPSSSYFNSLAHLSCSVISITTHGSLILQLTSPKLIPFGRVVPSHSLHLAGQYVLYGPCTVIWNNSLPAVPPPCISSLQGYFSPGLFLTRDKVPSILRLLLQHLGFFTESYASHSFRIGAATTAAEAGLPSGLSIPFPDGPAIAPPNISEHLLQYSKRSLPS